MSEEYVNASVVYLPSRWYVALCAVAGLSLFASGLFLPLPGWLVGAEVLLTVFILFVFGSLRYRLDKNAVTYGALAVIVGTFLPIWWPASPLRDAFHSGGSGAAATVSLRYLLSFKNLEHLIHADTVLFIVGLTFFVSTVAQSRLLESVGSFLINRSKGNVATAIALVALIVGFLSGILDGVSMIGLMIRVLLIILVLAGADLPALIFPVILSTVVTTVCGMWLAYGEPPNLIMKANLAPLLNDRFFLRYCMPTALGAYVIVYFNIRRKLSGYRINLDTLDLLDRWIADIRFLQAATSGRVCSTLEFCLENKDRLAERFEGVLGRLRHGEPFGAVLIKEHVAEDKRKELWSDFLSSDLGPHLDRYYVSLVEKGTIDEEDLQYVTQAFTALRRQRWRSQVIAGLSFVPFIAMLAWHAVNHSIPLFFSSAAGFLCSLFAVRSYPAMRRLALRDAAHEAKDYAFLLPLFFSISLMSALGTFERLASLIELGLQTMGQTLLAMAQFLIAGVLSALLDNNVVADFGGRALRGFDPLLVKLFAQAQIAGYAVGGCLTHIGCAQSVVAYSIIVKELRADFSPLEWVKEAWPIVLELTLWVLLVIWVESSFFH